MENQNLSRDLINKLTDFLVCNIGEKAKYGITYVMAYKEDTAVCKDGMAIREAIKNEGLKSEEIFRVYEVSNGYIFDMNLNICRKISMLLAEAVAASNGGKSPRGDLIADTPMKRRSKDMTKLAELCKKQYESGKTTFDIALFSRNTVPTINIQGTDRAGNKVSISYDAFALKHWDVAEMSLDILVPKYGIKVSRIAPGEILSSKTGVRFTLTLARAV